MGLPQTGKTTLFKNITKSKAAVFDFYGGRKLAHCGDNITFRIIDKSSYKNGDSLPNELKYNQYGYIFVYDITNQESLDYVQKWLNENPDNKMPFWIIGTKSDLSTDRRISSTGVKDLYTDNSFSQNCKGVFEVSNLLPDTVEEAFSQIVDSIYKNILKIGESHDEKVWNKKLQAFTPHQKSYWRDLEKIWRKSSHVIRSEEEKIIDILNDYTKNNSKFMRFFTLHWNRHHVSAIQAVVNEAQNKTSEQLLKKIENIKLVNTQGSVATIIDFIKANLNISEDQPDNDFRNEFKN